MSHPSHALHTNHAHRVELGYNAIKGTEYFVTLRTSVVITKEYNMTVRVRN